MSTTHCPKCNSENIYADANLWICPECGHEWSQFASAQESESQMKSKSGTSGQGDGQNDGLIRDAHGNVLSNGDSVTVIKELRIKGSSSVVKVGTKVKNIRLSDGDDGHNISCKIDGIGAMNLKSEFVKKA